MSKFTLNLAIETAIRAESLSVRFYKELADKLTKSPDIKMQLEKIALQKAEHKRIFEGLLTRATQKHSKALEADVDFLKTVDISSYFDDLEVIDAHKKPSEIIKFAYDFEKDTVLFYIALHDLYGHNDILDEIIRNEKAHMTMLMKYLLTELRFKGVEDVWD